MPEQRNKTKRPAGFTLLEMLVAFSVLALAVVAIAASFATGIRAWSAAMEVSGAEEASQVELAVLRRDLMNARRFGPLTFEGGPNSISFPIVLSEPDEQIGLVRYWHDPHEQVLFRQTRPIRAVNNGLVNGAERWIARVENVTFEYLPFPETGLASDSLMPWLDAWTRTDRQPLGVRLRLRLRTLPDEIAETVILPYRQWLEDENTD